MDYCSYFKGKRITVMGLGLLGRGVGDTAFLAKCGAELIVTDLQSREELGPSLEELSQFKNITYVFGEHRFEDFRNRDFILKAAGVPNDSPYLKEARKHNVPIKMSASLFEELSHALLIGITGTRGKSTVTHMLYEILERNYALGLSRTAKGSAAGRTGLLGRPVLGGNVRGIANLPLLEKVTNESVALFELDSWQLQGFADAKISPHIAVFTTFYPDHLNYYKGDLEAYFRDKTAIFAFQRAEDYLVVGKQAYEEIQRRYREKIESAVIVAEDIPSAWKLSIPGEHNRLNAGIAREVGRVLGVDDNVIRDALQVFKGVSGRLELAREIQDVKIYNDTTATTPEATIAALRALGDRGKRNIVLIIGGADKGLDMSELLKEIKQFCKFVVLLKGTGTGKLQTAYLDVKTVTVDTLKEAVTRAFKETVAGDVLLFSPAFASFGMFKNEYDRGDQFNQFVRELK